MQQNASGPVIWVPEFMIVKSDSLGEAYLRIGLPDATLICLISLSEPHILSLWPRNSRVFSLFLFSVYIKVAVVISLFIPVSCKTLMCLENSVFDKQPFQLEYHICCYSLLTD